MRGVRGAVSADNNSAEAIQAATQWLLKTMVERNAIDLVDVVSIFFSTTVDLTTDFPAHAARLMGEDWKQVPMMCCHEMSVPGSLPRCIRVMMHWQTDKSQRAIEHVYLGEAEALRPDLV